MKRKIVTLLFAMCVALGMSACGAKEEKEAKEAKEVKEATEEVSVETADNGLSDDEKEELRLLGKFLDVDLYIENDGTIRENKCDKDLSHMFVNGTRFELGMSYDDVLNLGYKPDNEEFMNEKLSSTFHKVEKFSNSAGSTVELGFSVKREVEDKKEVPTAKEDGYLYSIKPEKSFTVAGFTESFAPVEIVESLGYPYRLDCGLFKDYPDAKLEYINSDSNNKVLSVYINLETDEITSVQLEGYTE